MNVREKGALAEREVAELLRGWWDPLEPGCKFARTPGSGGWSTANNREAFGTAGDLVTTAVLFPFAVEVKRREGWTDGELLAGRRSPVWGWWRQCQKAALEMQKVPMLWFRRSRRPWLVIMPIGFCAAPYEVAGRDPTPVVQILAPGIPTPVHQWATMKVVPGNLWPALWLARYVLRTDPRVFVRGRRTTMRGTKLANHA
jgi:hypothetical protein